jgi:hypothetical protein
MWLLVLEPWVHIFAAELGSHAFPLRYRYDRLGDFSETIQNLTSNP